MASAACFRNCVYICRIGPVPVGFAACYALCAAGCVARDPYPGISSGSPERPLP